MSIFSHFQERFEATRQEEYSLQEYLDLCKQDKTAYASAAERLLMAIGEPELLDTSVDSRLSRIFSNKVIRRYPAFADFHGMEECIDQIVAFFRHAAQGLEEKKQILYLLGPVGGGKSSLAEKLKQLMEKVPFYAIKGSPVFESPLGLFNPDEDGAILEEDYGIPRRYLRSIMSPWATKRLNEFGGDISQFRVVKLYPSILNQIAIAKTEPGDENNQDISALVGKVDIRKLEEYPQNDADAYSYSGALCRANQGLMEFVEMFKAPIKVLHPLLTATQEGNYNSTEGLGALPYSGIILAHSNESEWHSFRNNKNNEAFIDRIYIVKVPYCLRVADEIKIYDKLLVNSSLAHAHCAPDTLKMLSQFSVLSRLKEPENSNIYSKMRVYDGENLKDTDPKAKSIQEYRDPETGEILNRAALNEELEKIEKPAGISNPKDFRNEIVNFVLRARAGNNGKNPSWLSYEKLRVVIEKKMFSNTEDLLPVISFNAKASKEDQQKHNDFVKRMVERGYTEKQVRLLSEWYLRVRKSQ
ncbi:PrkA family serine protein kinase [Pseudomonas aeruginosa]|uniref:PrkA family serine protein kinase n=1 Tax=Pseudomonas aeruginosa TaxID=287 RepID=UPI000F533259|nr:PrkA family serine protein kinase [Pseudomonas aeruginosa]RQA37793.1 PrkA family serine protein kinase [Pseudomonas aeruginosa]